MGGENQGTGFLNGLLRLEAYFYKAGFVGEFPGLYFQRPGNRIKVSNVCRHKKVNSRIAGNRTRRHSSFPRLPCEWVFSRYSGVHENHRNRVGFPIFHRRNNISRRVLLKLHTVVCVLSLLSSMMVSVMKSLRVYFRPIPKTRCLCHKDRVVACFKPINMILS